MLSCWTLAVAPAARMCDLHLLGSLEAPRLSLWSSPGAASRSPARTQGLGPVRDVHVRGHSLAVRQFRGMVRGRWVRGSQSRGQEVCFPVVTVGL